MKTLKQHINEALKIGKDLSEWSSYSCQPTTKDELKEIIDARISKEGPNCDLNDIDVSQITDISWLFEESEFNGDISKWDVSNVKNMKGIFKKSDFNGDISEWNTSKVEDMSYMFEKSHFNGDISKWDVRNVRYTRTMFKDCPIKEEYKPKPLQYA